jgi:glutamyl-tRNA reductase
MTILAIGACYKTAATELLERLSVSQGELETILRRLHGSTAIAETMVLSTCNRTEVYVATNASQRQSAHSVDHFFAARAGLSISEIRGFLQVRYEPEAVTHLCAVACGLDSMATGEEHIVAQLRTALRAAQSAGTARGVLTSAVDTAFRASKRARTETRIGSTTPSLLAAGLELGGAVLGGLTGRKAVLIGSGAIGSLAAKTLRAEGVDDIMVASRTPANAQKLAAMVDGVVLGPGELTEALSRCDVLVSATGAAEPVVSADVLHAARRTTGYAPMFCLDLAMPRDIERACRDIDGVSVVDLEVLGSFLAGRGEPSELDAVWKIVAEEAAGYTSSRRTAVAAPLITALRSRATNLVTDELVRLRSRLPALGLRERAETEAALNRVVRKLLHTPTVRVKELSTAADGGLYVEALSQLFDLELQSTVDTNEVSRS